MIDPDNFTVSSDIGRICAQGEGAWRRRLVIDPDNFRVSSDIGRICVQGEGAWRRQLQKMNVLPFFSRAEQRPFKIPVHVPDELSFFFLD